MSQFGFKNVGHLFATVAGDIVKGAKAVAHVMLQAQKAEPEVEAITSLIFPQAVELDRGALPCWEWPRKRWVRLVMRWRPMG
jgi:hypothetical protein